MNNSSNFLAQTLKSDDRLIRIQLASLYWCFNFCKNAGSLTGTPATTRVALRGAFCLSLGSQEAGLCRHDVLNRIFLLVLQEDLVVLMA